MVSAVACALSAFMIASLLPDRYTAEAVIIVPASAAGTAGEATNLATTYADLIPEDRQILGSVASQIGRTQDEVLKNALVTHDFDTSLLRLSYTDGDSSIAIAGARIFAQAVTGPEPVSPRIAPGSLAIVHLPSIASSRTMSGIQVAILGVILGIALAIVLILAWERSDGRIDHVKALSTEAGCAASSLDQTTSRSLGALLDRWIDLGGAPPVRVALLAVAESSEKAAVAVADQLLEGWVRSERRSARDGMSPSEEQLVIDVGGTPGGTAAGEVLALEADVIVLVAVNGTRAAEVRETVAILSQFGKQPSWALLVRPSRKRGEEFVAPASTPLPSASRQERAMMLVDGRQRPGAVPMGRGLGAPPAQAHDGGSAGRPGAPD